MIFVRYIPPYYMDTRLLIIGNTNFISSYSIPAGKARQDAKALFYNPFQTGESSTDFDVFPKQSGLQ